MKVKFNKTVLTNLVKANGYKVLQVNIYEDGTQADVIAQDECYGDFKCFVIPRYEYTNAVLENAMKVKCYFSVFGLDGLFDTKLFF